VRRRLLDAALEVFAERGYASANLDEVAAAAGLTKGAIYSNFDSKDDLFFAMMKDQVLGRVEAVRAALEAGAGAPGGQQAVRDIGRLLTEAFIQQREWQLVFLDFWRRAVQDDDVRAQFVAHRRALRAAIADRVEQVLGRAPALGGFTVDDIVTVVLALCNGLAIEQYADPDLVSDDLFGRVLAQLAHEATGTPHATNGTSTAP
jgi:AcrR family transcriptional regulator